MKDEITTVQNRILEASVDIRQETALEVVFQHGIFCQVGLPRRRVDGHVFERTFKNASILIEAGKLWDGKKWVQQPLPSGPKPRLALIHINSEAVRTQSPHVEIGDSCSQFLRKLGLPDQDGRTYRLFKKQMMSLAAARLSMGFSLGNEAITIDAKPIKEFRAWVGNDENQTALWPGTLQLSQEYFESLLDHAVPLDPRALHALSHSALALDIYSWLGRRLYTLSKPVKVTFRQLKEQFGQEYKGKNADDDFRTEFIRITKQVLSVYPDAKVNQVIGGFVLNPSRAPIPKTVIPGRKFEQREALPTPRVDRHGELLPATLDKFRALYPRLDVYACQADFNYWLKNKKKTTTNYNRAFLGFAKKWMKDKG